MYKFKHYILRACYDPNGDVYKFACDVVSAEESERHFFENGWCHFLFDKLEFDSITTVSILFLNEAPYVTVPISVLLSDCPEFQVFPSYFETSASAVGTSGNEQGEDFVPVTKERSYDEMLDK